MNFDMDNYSPQPGTSIKDLETPCFILDMDSFEHNLRVVAETYTSTVKMRAHTKNLKSPFLANYQIKSGGTSGGICTAKVSEAEVMIEGGITDILIPNQIVTPDKLNRLCGLARRADIKVCIAEPQNLQDISRIASENDVTIGILVEVDTSMDRGGIRQVEDGVGLAKLTQALPNVEFRGVMSHQHVDGWPTLEERVNIGRKYVQMCLDVKDAIEAAGISVEIVSSGETFSYKIAAEMDGVTEVEGGTYAFMDTMLGFMDEFRYAGKLLGTVISKPNANVAIGDVGLRSLCTINGEYGPSVEGVPGVKVRDLHDDHMALYSEEAIPLQVGDTYTLIPGYQDGVVNRWDQIIGIRNGVVEGVWAIPGRGCFY